MKLTRKVIAAVTATALAVGAATATHVSANEGVTATTVAGNTPVGIVKPWNTHPAPVKVGTNKPQDWVSKLATTKLEAYWVSSPSMGRDIPVAVIPAGKPDAPTIYLLNGAGGSEQNFDWINMADTIGFYGDKGVNVVIPMEGAFSYYTDWIETPKGPYFKGPQKWETFLTKELPGPIESKLGANKTKRAIIGSSMSGTPALVLPSHYEGFYTAAASFSGCPATSTLAPYNFARLTVNRGGGGDLTSATPEKMWGPMGGDYNRYNDALVTMDKLKKTRLYLSWSSGLASENDLPSSIANRLNEGETDRAKRVTNTLQASSASATLIVEGGVIEGAINSCNHDFKVKADKIGLNKEPGFNHYEIRPTGTHSWPDWRKDIVTSWYRTIAPAFFEVAPTAPPK